MYNSLDALTSLAEYINTAAFGPAGGFPCEFEEFLLWTTRLEAAAATRFVSTRRAYNYQFV